MLEQRLIGLDLTVKDGDYQQKQNGNMLLEEMKILSMLVQII